MGFDLYFCWRKDERVDFNAVANWARGAGSFTQNKNQLWYENPSTGVYFSLDFDPQGWTTPGDSPIPDGYFDSGLSFGLNFNRPSFFGHEALPFVEQLARRFDLCVVDPQVGADSPVLMSEVDARRLIDSWLEHNRWAILTLVKDPSFSNPLRMPITSSMYLWRYKKAKIDLERLCGEEIFVPNLVPVHRLGNVTIGRAFACAQGVSTIVPESDWVFIPQGKKRLFRAGETQEVGAITFDTFRDLLVRQIEVFEWTGPTVQVIRLESVDRAGKILQQVEHMLDRSEVEIVGIDSFVDIELSEDK